MIIIWMALLVQCIGIVLANWFSDSDFPFRIFTFLGLAGSLVGAYFACRKAKGIYRWFLIILGIGGIIELFGVIWSRIWIYRNGMPIRPTSPPQMMTWSGFSILFFFTIFASVAGFAFRKKRSG